MFITINNEELVVNAVPFYVSSAYVHLDAVRSTGKLSSVIKSCIHTSKTLK